jgi:dipeptidyl aminopeptidase/acylaminoacyl peptidase
LAVGGGLAQAQTDLVIRDLFPKRPFFGKAAKSMAWSHNDRYLGYLWNPYEDRGLDLWVLDTKTGKTTRLTSPDAMQPFDQELGEVKERYAKLDAEAKQRLSLSEEERWRLEDEDSRKDKERKEPQRHYSGVSEFAWAKTRDEMLFVYEGDLYRLRIDGKAPEQITKTTDAETSPLYGKDDQNFTFCRGGGLFRAQWDRPNVDQLNPKLPDGLWPDDYRLSPDGRWLMVSAWKSTGQPRQVSIATYTDRFMRPRTVNREAADDPFNAESRLFLVDLKTPLAKPWEIYRFPGGTKLLRSSVAGEPWSADSKKFAFGTWARDTRTIELKVADMDRKQVQTVFQDTHRGDHATPLWTYPQFLPNGDLIALLEKSGYRQVWRIDPAAKTATQITPGDFEALPVRLAKDGKTLFVRSNRHHPARMDVYTVALPSGEMRRLSRQDGQYDNWVVSNDGQRVAGVFQSWSSPYEMFLIDPKGERKMTESHSGTFASIDKVRPQLFSYKNRHGQTIHGYLFLPPGWRKDAKHPLIVYVYGGPGRQVTDGSFGSSGYLFNMYMAYRYGLVTATIDPRGTTFTGGPFADANFGQPGVPQTEDLEDGVKFLDEQYGVDRSRVGLYGWSFGGFQVQHTMYTSDVFTLGISGAGPTEWQNYNNWYSGSVIGLADWDKYSLTKIAKNLKHPLLLMHGMEDDNVLFQDTVKVYRELMQAGKGPLVELVVDPTGGHGLGGDLNTRLAQEIYEGFIIRRWGLKPIR